MSKGNTLPDSIERLSRLLAKLPGLGSRSARRTVLYLLQNRETKFPEILHALEDLDKNIHTCTVCGNFDDHDPCRICNNPDRSNKQLCIVESVGDLWAMERSRLFKGRYHVLGGTLSALDGRTPDQLNLASLEGRIALEGITEVILALNATIEGQTTSHYILDMLNDTPLTITQLAQGLPIGGELEYLDEGTLFAALKSRRSARI